MDISSLLKNFPPLPSITVHQSPKADTKLSIEYKETTRVCVKVGQLRKLGYESFEDWLKDDRNIYCGRHGRIFIHKNGQKNIFHYQKSEFHNPFTVKEHGLGVCLEKFKKYLEDSPELLKKLQKLKGKNLGCWCNPRNKCHVDVLIENIE